MQGMDRLLGALDHGQPAVRGGGAGIMAGQILSVKRAEKLEIVLAANGLRIEVEDLRFASDLAAQLEEKDTVLLYTPDGQIYYIFCKVVEA